ncbi:MAG TPA: hypothetical protein VJH55_02430 [Candidatus Paceibacterota bacterium]
MSERAKYLKQLIEEDKMDMAFEVATNTQDYNESEHLVFAVLTSEKSSPKLISATLEAFEKTRQNWKQGNRGGGHGGWVHSLSHFTEDLWKRRLVTWIKRLNEVAFRGATELGDSGCCDRLVHDFGKYARHDDNPADFGLFADNMPWLDLEYYGVDKLRIEHGVFESPEALERFQLEHELRHPASYWSVKDIEKRIRRLTELGAPTDEFTDTSRKFLEDRVKVEEADLADISTRPWDKEVKKLREKEAREHIEKLRQQLAKLG